MKIGHESGVRKVFTVFHTWKKYYLLLPGTPEQILLRKTLVTFFVEQAQKGWQSQLCLFLKNQLVFFGVEFVNFVGTDHKTVAA